MIRPAIACCKLSWRLKQKQASAKCLKKKDRQWQDDGSENASQGYMRDVAAISNLMVKAVI